MRKKKNLQGCPHLIYLLILRFPCKYHCLSSSYLKLISHHPPHFSHFFGQGRLLISLIPCSHLNADRYDEDMVNIFLLFYSLCCWLKSFCIDFETSILFNRYSGDLVFFLELRRVMDITDFTITHHLMIVLLLLRLVSVFDNRDPVPYFISLIYLCMVLIVHSLPSFSFFFFFMDDWSVYIEALLFTCLTSSTKRFMSGMS